MTSNGPSPDRPRHRTAPAVLVRDGEARDLDALGIRRRLGRDNWSTPTQYAGCGWSYSHLSGTATVIVSSGLFDDGQQWVHASIARADGTLPTYPDLTQLARAVWPTGYAFQVFAPPDRHINIHPSALHLWGLIDGFNPLPDFACDGTI